MKRKRKKNKKITKKMKIKIIKWNKSSTTENAQ